MVDGAAALWGKADIVFKVRGPAVEEIGLMREGTTLIPSLARAEPGTDEATRRQEGNGARHRLAAAHTEPRPEDGPR